MIINTDPNTVFGMTNITREQVGGIIIRDIFQTPESEEIYESEDIVTALEDDEDSSCRCEVHITPGNLWSKMTSISDGLYMVEIHPVFGEITGFSSSGYTMNNVFSFPNLEFFYCPGPSFNTLKMNANFKNAFVNCGNLKNVTLNYLTCINDTGTGQWNAKNIFVNCNNLTDVSLRNWTVEENGCGTHAPIQISNFFSNKNSVINLDCQNWTFKRSNQNFLSCFYGMYNLKNLNFANWNTEAITGSNISLSFFAGSCRNLTDIDLSPFKNIKVTNLADCFRYCENIQSIIGIGNWQIQNFSNFTYCCYYGFKNSTLDLSNLSWANNGTAISLKGAFENCYYLKNLITSGKWDIDILQYEGLQNIFMKCLSLSEVPTININFWTNYKVLITPAQYSIDSAFYKCENLKEINLYINKIDDMLICGPQGKNLFAECNNLTTIRGFNTIPRWNDIDGIFFNCRKLSNINLENFYFTPNIEQENYYGSLNNCFHNCFSLNLEEVPLEEWNVSKVSNFAYFAAGLDINNVFLEKISNWSSSCNNIIFKGFFQGSNLDVRREYLHISFLDTKCSRY